MLVVEDEDSILSCTKSLLERLGYKVFIARTPAEAIKNYIQQSGMVHLALPDGMMPEMTVRVFLGLKRTHLDLLGLFMPGNSSNVTTRHCVLSGVVIFLKTIFQQNACQKNSENSR